MSENLTPEVLANAAALAKEYRPSMTLDVVHSWGADAANKLTALLTALEEAEERLACFRTNYDDLLRKLSLSRARAEKAEQQVAAFRDAVVMTPGPEGRRSWGVNAAKLAAAWDLSPNKSEADDNG